MKIRVFGFARNENYGSDDTDNHFQKNVEVGVNDEMKSAKQIGVAHRVAQK